MGMFDRPKAHAALEQLLAQERHNLLAGRFDGLEATLRAKTRLLDRLRSERTDPRQLEALRTKALRNQALLAAAGKGIEAARNRLAAIQATPDPMRTYARDGTTAAIAPPNRKDVNRRA